MRRYAGAGCRAPGLAFETWEATNPLRASSERPAAPQVPGLIFRAFLRREGKLITLYTNRRNLHPCFVLPLDVHCDCRSR